jgi:hypothetical protein
MEEPPRGLIIEGRASAIRLLRDVVLPYFRCNGSMHLCDFCWCGEMAISHAHLATYIPLSYFSWKLTRSISIDLMVAYRIVRLRLIRTTAAGSSTLLLRYQPSPTRLAFRERPWGRGMCIDPFLKRPGVHMLTYHLLFARLCNARIDYSCL